MGLVSGAGSPRVSGQHPASVVCLSLYRRHVIDEGVLLRIPELLGPPVDLLRRDSSPINFPKVQGRILHPNRRTYNSRYRPGWTSLSTTTLDPPSVGTPPPERPVPRFDSPSFSLGVDPSPGRGIPYPTSCPHKPPSTRVPSLWSGWDND